MLLIKRVGDASETACETPSAAPFATWRVASHVRLLTSVLGLQVPHVGCSEAWGPGPKTSRPPGGTLGPGPSLPIGSGCHLWLWDSKRELSTLQLPLGSS